MNLLIALSHTLKFCGEIYPTKGFYNTLAPESVKRQDGKKVIVLSYGHIFTIETMDMHMGMEVIIKVQSNEDGLQLKSFQHY
ncbi:231_t:CDS:2 [Funneliformis geosporum]|uniref:231_t:CDS:1 n=1 Tax=Funneliformis geosporum TaxID=1117311 RepID=A0A9W4WU86_9GLOM|nr:231_t:CDS:2 [Funneliformis geosporum]